MPTATITFSERYLTFRFDTISRQELDANVSQLKRRFPSMNWNGTQKVWTLPSSELQPFYETCREIVGPANVNLVSHYNLSARPIQGRLFD